jgi:predicted transposase/invertase (TIGR01784 family)
METIYSDNQIFLPIISDYGFKATFGNETNTLFLRKALQALIKSDFAIKEVKFDKNSFEGISQDGRSGIVDLACVDENNNHFIVEMQYGEEPNFIQRMKFYALHKFNAMVKRGKFDYSSLPKIYCVPILAKNILPFPNYHTVANLRNEKGELFDTQITFVTIELDKFTLTDNICKTDLEKLIYTMKMLHKVTQPIQFPKFWDEKWLKIAIDELDSRKMSPDEKANLEILIARNAEAVYSEKRKIDAEKEKIVINLLLDGQMNDAKIAKMANVTLAFVNKVKQKLN